MLEDTNSLDAPHMMCGATATEHFLVVWFDYFVLNVSSVLHWRDMKTQHLTSGPVFNEIEMVRQALNCLSC